MRWQVVSGWVGLGLCVVLAGCGGSGASNAYTQPTFGGNLPPAGREGSPLPKLTAFITSEPVVDTPVALALWENQSKPELSKIVVAERRTDRGFLDMFDFQGKQLGRLELNAPMKSLDARANCHFGEAVISLAVTIAADEKAVHFYTWLDKEKSWKELGFDGLKLAPFEKADVTPLACALYRRPSDGAVFLFLSPSLGPLENHLLAYRVGYTDDKLTLLPLPRFGRFAGRNPAGDGAISRLIVDDSTGDLFAWDERFGIRKIPVDSLKKDAFLEDGSYGKELATGGSAALAFTKEKVVLARNAPEGSSIAFFDRGGKHQLSNSGNLPVQTGTALLVFPNFISEQLPSGALVALDTFQRTFAIFDTRSLSGSLPTFMAAQGGDPAAPVTKHPKPSQRPPKLP